MRILFFNYEYPPLGGGAANATSYILKEYSKIPGLEVELVTSSIDEKYHLEEIGKNVKIHKLPIGKNSANLHFQSQKDLLVYAWKAYGFSKKLISEARKEGSPFDLTHSFFTVPCGFLSLRMRSIFGLPYIVSLRGADVPGYSERFSLIYGLLKPLVKRIWKRSAAVISNSQGLKDLALKTDSSQKIGVIYNGINVEEFQPASFGSSTSKMEAEPPFTILCTSRLTPRKGINYLVDAMERITTDGYENVKLVIVGDGNASEDLKNQAALLSCKDKIEFTGRVPHEKVNGIFSASSVFVLPSLNEGMSNTMLEALASGLPIIATDTGGTRELVGEGVNGFIIKMKDSADIAEKIEKLIRNPELQKSMAKKSRERAEQLSWTNVASDYHKLYKSIADRIQ